MNQYFANELATNYCGNCDKRFKSNSGFRSHFKTYHKVPNVYERPNIKDVNLYCASCKKISYNKLTFSEHMKYVHSLDLEFDYGGIDPDTKDESQYPDDLSSIHKVKVENIRDRSSDDHNKRDLETEDVSSDSYCDKCKLNCESKEAYDLHKKKEHNNKKEEFNRRLQLLDRKRTAVVEEEEEPNQTQIPKKKPKKHRFGTIFQPGLMPDESSAKDYCCACDRNFVNRKSYRRHLLYVHKEIMTRTPVTEDNVPDPNHEYFYCSICDKRAISKRAFHFHLRAIHIMEFD